MNKLKGFIKSIKSSKSISIVEVKVGNQIFKSVVLETPESSSYLKEKNEVYILFKETEVAIGKNFYGDISLSNKIKCKIVNIEEGKIISKIELTFEDKNIISIITTDSLKKMNLKENDEIIAFIKANEVYLMEV